MPPTDYLQADYLSTYKGIKRPDNELLLIGLYHGYRSTLEKIKIMIKVVE